MNLTELLGDYLGNRQHIDEQTQGWINQAHNYGDETNGGESEAAWRYAKSLRNEQPNSVPLRNAEHYLWSEAGAGAPGLMQLPYLAYKYLRGDSVKDPWGELKWGSMPIFTGYRRPDDARISQ